ncbi:MBL fold metallo-hydrolase [Salinibaculum rarum]|uniref:MBL fold metallo-hydrolase n=1 Tax=Salinibaculum rarum TaxID=3058903 RepID=UPI00265F3200|nr:MBL fold metallo-hydrolase [Salinibaculum sp. KK48]
MTEDGEYPDPPADVPSVSPTSLKRQLDRGESVRLLDVRDRDEIEQWHVDGPSVTRTDIPYAKFMQAKVRDTVADLASDIDGERPATVVCGHGEASAFVAGLLSEAGIDARNLAGGMDEWARVYDAHAIATDGPTVIQYQRPSSGCLAYMIEDGGEALVVDPLAAFTDRYVTDAAERNVDIVAVVDTHIHADHVSGRRELAAETGARALVTEGAQARGITYDAETVTDGETLSVGDASVDIVGLPGHTTGMAGLAVGDVLLSGDSLFLDGVARPDLQEGGDVAAMAEELYWTLTERLARFADETILAPGHVDDQSTPAADGSYTAPLGTVRNRVPAFEQTQAEFVEQMTGALPPEPANAERIVALNLGRETADDEETFELELGPNNCAASAD